MRRKRRRAGDNGVCIPYGLQILSTPQMATTGTRGRDGSLKVGGREEPWTMGSPRSRYILRSRREGGTMESGFSQELRGRSSDQGWMKHWICAWRRGSGGIRERVPTSPPSSLWRGEKGRTRQPGEEGCAERKDASATG